MVHQQQDALHYITFCVSPPECRTKSQFIDC